MVEPIEPLVMESGERLEGQIKYYDYGVLSVIFELPFSGDWDTLVRLASRWVWDTDFTSQAMKIAKKQLERAAPALIKPYENWLLPLTLNFDEDRSQNWPLLITSTAQNLQLEVFGFIFM